MSIRNTTGQRPGVSWRVAAAVATALAGTLASQHVVAQEAAAEDLQEVTVTGSRIVRRDLTASSPIVTVAEDTFENTSAVSVEAALNELPQFKPDRTQFVAGDVQASAFNTPGISSVNLRGLGSNRNLVLLDGRRAQPANATLTVDVNSIPSAAISNVEIISGGASATYGADAIAGVVNFKLKRDFQGLVVDLQSGITEQGDGEETRISALVGGNFGDGQGNVMVGLEMARREGILQEDRDFYVQGFRDPGTTTSSPLYSFAAWNPAGQNPTQAAVNSVFGATPLAARSTPFFVNYDGTLFKQGPARRYNSTAPNVKLATTNNTLTQPETDSQISSPMDRYSIFARGHFDFNENVSAFVQGNLSSFKVDQIGAFAPATSFWSAFVPRDAAHPIPAELATLLDNRQTGPVNARVDVPDNAPWQMERILDYLGPRSSTNQSTVYQILAGLEGKLGLGDWTWEAYVSHGETNTTNVLQKGFASFQRYQTLISAPNYGANYRQPPDANLDTLGYRMSCTSGLPVFTSFTPTQDCIDAISIRMKNLTEFKQDIVEANLQGGVFTLPAGEVRAAVGATYRKNEVSFDPDSLNDRESTIDRPIGLFAANDTAGSITAREIYAEALVPVLRDLPAIRELSLELGGRYSDYSTEGGLTTYKALLNWKLNDYLSFRGGYQRANRAPNTAELFTGPTTTVAGFPLSDPCASNTNAPWGNKAANPNRARVQALCAALNGNPNTTFSADPNNFLGGNGGFFPLELEIRRGNTDLESEKAKTYTAGVILRSPFESAALSGFTASVDWYSITIDDAIAPLPGTTIYENCFNANGTSNPNYQINDPGGYCSRIFRDPITGGRATVDSPYSNLGTIETSGIDTQINWRANFADLGAESIPGALTAGIAFNYLLKYDTQQIPGGPFVDNKDTLAQNGQFRYRSNMNVGYALNALSFGLTWQYLPSVRNAAAATLPTTTIQGAGAYSLFDLNARWEVSKIVSLRFGIDNLLDTDPEIVGRNPGVTAGLGATLPNFYDVLGRRYYAGVKLTF
ncbi:MAG: TonB-dependent receptor [Steroidobacteraceae bacterium]